MMNTPIPEAAARAARHCDELLSKAATPPDLDLEFARFARGFAEQANTHLSVLCDDRGLTAEIVDTGLQPVGEWYATVGAAHRHSFFSLGQESRGILVSVPIGELAGQFERILGGTGEVDESCTTLPASAMRFAQQFEDKMAEILRRTSDRREIAATANGDEVEQVAPFGASERVWTATLAVSSVKSPRVWQVRLAVCNAMIAEIVGTRAVSPATGRTIGARGIDGSAIAEVDLPLRAVLVDVPMSVARLASLAPGAVIPVAVNRNVPLLTGNLTIAHGCVGELDDRVALELTQSFLSE
ncbi:FliM/FliN family flagellar motor C-terminal domain-containing protein [Erythrobacter sp.]|uniref:FliM/FliN family flagellar motor C-terminal domain-containing protein n=1 Tax=Erythrobacter sp. TaxID=1042 RepID=UPI001B2218C2|nr:FliM/FliN family flagellar motor C-terminal domain-containing protein [Erythrobacter sp.]MBO6527433.1 FliM/FliN family flagellar motor switch protein [Erythrobacter sp.]MBO6530817.1 FliM/FliN family flagellar motor switch protein [Erythrobacter sp.]